MPTTKVKLGRNQTLSLDGAVLEGVREVDVTIDTEDFNVSSWEHNVTSSLPIRESRSISMLIYWEEDWLKIKDRINKQPPEPMTIDISGWGSGRFIAASARIAQPVTGIVTYDVTLKSWNYQ